MWIVDRKFSIHLQQLWKDRHFKTFIVKICRLKLCSIVREIQLFIKNKFGDILCKAQFSFLSLEHFIYGLNVEYEN